MRVHIVALENQWILGRCVTLLARGEGWTTGPRVDKSADVNYFAPYLLLKGSYRPSTKTAAWFTHREEAPSAKGKIATWHRVAGMVDLRITMAEKYRMELSQFGPTVNVPLPVDTVKFTPRPLRVGVAGQVYALSRKGETSVARLTKEPGLEVVAAGKGWPCPTTYYPWAKMQEFYRGLDVFLVTSEVEGGPVTMMEALACGIPVVAPTGVGMVDEFDVIKYPRGDYDAMLVRLLSMLRGRMRRRRMVMARTETAYVRAHEKAFEALCAE